MARRFSKVQVSLWADDDFRALTVDAQHLYLMLLTSAGVSMAGVHDWRPKRLAVLSPHFGADRITKAGLELWHTRFVMIDPDTEEIGIRSFVRHDGVLFNSKVAVGMVAAWNGIVSSNIRAMVACEVARLSEGLSPAVADAVAEVVDWAAEHEPSWPTEGLSEGLPEGLSEGPSDVLSEEASEGACTTSSLHPFIPSDTDAHHADADALVDVPADKPPLATAPKANKYPDEFEEFWKVYPVKKGKGAALKAWRKALKRATNDQLIAGAQRYRDDKKRDPEHTKYAEGWLSGDRWLDEPETKTSTTANWWEE